MTTTELAPPRDDIEDVARRLAPLVNHIAHGIRQSVPAHVRLDDLVSAGNLALVKAWHSYDPDEGVPFAKYAAIRIRGGILDELRSADFMPRLARRRARDARNAGDALTIDLGRTPTRIELAEKLGLNREQLDEIQAAATNGSVFSLDAAAAGDTDLADLLATDPKWSPEQVAMRRENLHLVRLAINALPERHRAVIEGAFLEERRLAAIAADLGVTESRVSQLRSEALRKIRLWMIRHDALEAA